MTRPGKLTDLARFEAVTAVPHPEPGEEFAAEPLVRYTAEIPKRLHRFLKLYAMDHDTSTYAVTRALISALRDDEAVAAKIAERLRAQE